MNGLKKYHLLALTILLSACSSATMTGYSEDGKTEIAASSALPSDHHPKVSEKAKTQETKIDKEQTKQEKTSKKKKETQAPKASNVKTEQKPLVDKITEEKDPDESDKRTAIRYMTDEEFIASVEKLDSVETTPIEKEELKTQAKAPVAKSNIQEQSNTKFVPTISYQLDTFYFANGSATLDSKYRKNIQKIAAEAKKHKNYIIRVAGHASSRTNDTDIASHKLANFKVSQKRADSVAKALRRAGVPSSKIVVEALSDSAPAYLEVMPEGERLNRRAEVFISY